MKKWDIEYSTQYNPEHEYLKEYNINPLRFDGYDKENKIAYEYQGQQHYYPVDFAGKGEKWAEEQYNIGKTRDNIKREYCKKSKIPLIEIPYWEYDNMESFLLKQIKSVKI